MPINREDIRRIFDGAGVDIPDDPGFFGQVPDPQDAEVRYVWANNVYFTLSKDALKFTFSCPLKCQCTGH